MKIKSVLLRRGEVFPNGDVISKDCEITIGKGVVGGPVFNDFNHDMVVGKLLNVDIKDGAVIAEADYWRELPNKELSIGYSTPNVRFDDDARIIEKIVIKTTSVVNKEANDE